MPRAQNHAFNGRRLQIESFHALAQFRFATKIAGSNYQHVVTLAKQLAFTGMRSSHSDADNDVKPPGDWSTTRAERFWNNLSDERQREWLVYAQLLTTTSEATSTSEAGGDDAPKVCPK